MKKVLIVIALLLTVANFNTGSEDYDKTATTTSDSPIEILW